MRRLFLRPVVFLIAALAVLSVPACTPTAGKPSVQIVSPPSGSQYQEGQEVAVQSASTDAAGVTRVELIVDNVVVRTDASPIPQGQPSLSLIQTWNATPGTHTIVVRAYNASGAMSDPVAISVSVGTSIAQATKPATAPPGVPTLPPPPATKPPASSSATSSQPATSSASSSQPPPPPPPPPPTDPPAPPPPPVCSGTPIIASLTALPGTITAGGSSTLSWGAVTNAESAEIDQGIGGVETPGSRSVSPGATTTFTLLARCGANTATKQATLTVNPPPPDVPAAPTGLSATTTGQTTASLTWVDNANNEDGFKVYRSISGGDPQVGTAAVHGGTGNMNSNLTGLSCSETYVLYVTSYKAGTESARSNYATITTDPCTPTSVTAPSHTGQKVTVNWTDNSTTPEETGFKIYFGATHKKTVSAQAGTGARSTEITGLDCGTAYSDIRVSAIYGVRESPKSSTAGNETTTGCQVKVEFTKVDIKNDTDTDPPWPLPDNPGEIRLRFTVEGATQYYPSSIGSESIKTGNSKSFSKVFNLTQLRSDPLNITVNADDVADDPDDMGTLTASHSGSLPTNFGAGAKTMENAFFKIYYTVTVTEPP